MNIKYDKILGRLRESDVTPSYSGYNIWGYVLNYSALPLGVSPTDPQIGDLVGCNTSQGVYLVNRRVKGFYKREAMTGVAIVDYGTEPYAYFPTTTAEIEDTTDRRYQTDLQKLYNDATSSIQGQLNSKEPSITGGTALQYWRGDKTFQTLDTLAVPENINLYWTQTRFNTSFAAKSTSDLSEGLNLYWTNARGIGATLTGYTSGAGTITAADSILSAIQKLDGNISAIAPTLASVLANGSSTNNIAITSPSALFTLSIFDTKAELLYSSGGIQNQFLADTTQVKLLHQGALPSTNGTLTITDSVINLSHDVAFTLSSPTNTITSVSGSYTVFGRINTTDGRFSAIDTGLGSTSTAIVSQGSSALSWSSSVLANNGGSIFASSAGATLRHGTSSSINFNDTGRAITKWYNGGFALTLQTSTSMTADYTMTLPIGNSTGTQALVNDGSGILSWQSLGSSSLLTTGAFVTTFAQSVTATMTLPTVAANLVGSNGALTATRVPFVTTNGVLVDNSNFTFNSTTQQLAITSTGTNHALVVGASANSGLGITVQNTNAGTAGASRIRILSNGGARQFDFSVNGSGFSTSGLVSSDQSVIQENTANGLLIANLSSTKTVFSVGGTAAANEVARYTATAATLGTAGFTYTYSTQKLALVSTGANDPLSANSNSGGSLGITVRNAAVTTTAAGRIRIQGSNQSTLDFITTCGSFTTAGLITDSQSIIQDSSDKGMLIASTGTAPIIKFSIGGTALANEILRITSSGVVVGLGTLATPTSTFQSTGSVSFPYVSKTANYTLTASDYTVDCTSGTFTITLPTAVGCAGRIYNIKNSGTGVITIATTGGQTIDGQVSGFWQIIRTGTIWPNMQVQSNGTNWIIL